MSETERQERELAELRERCTALEEQNARLQAEAAGNASLIDMVGASIPDALILTDLDLKITYVSRSGRDLFRVVGKDDVYERAAFEFIDPFDHGRVRDNLEKTLKNGLVRDVRYTFLRDDGSRFQGELSAARVLDDNGKAIAFAAVVRDVSVRIRREKEAEHARRLTQDRLDAFPGSAALFDAGGTIVATNDITAERLKGLGRDILGSNLFDLFPREEAEKRWGYVRSVLRSGKPARHRDERDGRQLDVFLTPVTSKPHGESQVALFALDITARVAAEEQIRRKEREYRTLAENLPGIVYRSMVGEKKMLVFNQLFETLTGYPPQDLPFGEVCKIDPLIVPEDRQAVLDEIENALLENRTFTASYRIRDKNGRIRHLISRGKPVAGASGKLARIDGVIFEETDRKEMEQALRDNEEKLQQIIAQMPYPMEICDSDGTAETVNLAFLEMFGIPSADMVERRYNVFDDQLVRELGLMEDVERVYAGELVEVREIAIPVADLVPGKRDDLDGMLYQEATMFPVVSEQGEVRNVVTIWKDITVQRRATELIKTQRDLAASLNVAEGMGDILDMCLESAMSCCGLDAGGIYLVDPDTGALSLRAHRGLDEAFVEATAELPGDSPQAILVAERIPKFTRYSDLGVPLDDVRRQPGFLGMAMIPVCYRAKAVACLNLASRQKEEIPFDCRETLAVIADQIGAAIERKRIEVELKENHDRLETLFDSIQDMVFVLDLRGRMVQVNRAVTDRLGFTVEELLGNPVTVVHAPDRRDEAVSVMGRLIAGEASVCTIPLLSKTGEEVPVETRVTHAKWGGRNVLVGISRDMTENVEAERALRAAKEYAELLFDVTPSAIFTVDAKKHITGWNMKIEEITGFAYDEVVGKSCTEVLPECCENGCVLGGDRDQDREPHVATITCKSGKVRQVLKNSEVLLGAGGEVVGGITSFVDVTDQMNAEAALKDSLERLRSSQAQLIHAAKMSSVGQLAAGIAHEINNPLAVINSSAELLEEFLEAVAGDEAGRGDFARKHLGKITQNVFRCKGIIDNFVEFSRHDEEEAEVELFDLLNRVCELARGGARAKSRVFIISAESVPRLTPEFLETLPERVTADPLETGVCRAYNVRKHQLQQVLLNLLLNAVDATEAGDTILLSCAEGERGVTLNIVDTGRGIAPEHLDRVFDPFFSTGPRGRRQGLGLYLSHQIVSGMDGRITLESIDGKGTVVRLWLPGKNP